MKFVYIFSVLAGLLSLGRPEAIAGSYTNDFSSSVGAAVTNGNTSLVGGQLQLTPNATSQYGTLLINDLDPGLAIKSFTATFDLTIDSHGAQGADGFSLNFANPSSYPGVTANYEQGVGSGLNFQFITYTANATCLSTNKNPVLYSITYGSIMTDGTKQPVTITYNRSTGASISYRNQTISVTAAQLSAFVPQAGFKFLFGARCGSNTENHLIDNVNITTVPISTNALLANIVPDAGTISPSFSSNTFSYSVNVSNSVTNINFTATAAQTNATVKINGGVATVASASATIALPNIGANNFTIVVTAEDGTTTKTNNITVNRAPSSNANLSNLVLSAGTLSPTFSSGTTNYTVDVSNATSSMTVTPTLADTNATMTVNGTPVSSGNASGSISLGYGTNTITIAVTAQDATTTKTYTLKVTRLTPQDADLTAIGLSAGTLVPDFVRSTYNYTVTVPFAVSSMTITATAVRANSTVSINGGTATAGSATNTIALNVGNNPVAIQVNAGFGITTTYTIGISRVLSSNADLSNLATSVHGGLTPAFDPATTNYTGSVVSTITGTYVVPTLADTNASVSLRVNGGSYTNVASGSINIATFNYGTNTIDARVTAQDGVTVKTYTAFVVRADPSTNANLANLDVANPAGGGLSPGFNAATTNYSVAAALLATNIAIIPTVADDAAGLELRVNGGSYISASSGGANFVALIPGTNTVDVRVTAQDGTTTKIYSLLITRLPASTNAILSDLTLTNVTMTPPFFPATNSYTAAVANAYNFTTVTPATAHPFATVEARVNGSNYIAVASGTASAPLIFQAGTNVVEIRVTAEDGITRQIYAVTVIRSSNPGEVDPLDAQVGAVRVSAMAVQADEKILLLSFSLSSVGGVPKNSLARINGDGSLDATFTYEPVAGFSPHVAVRREGTVAVMLGNKLTHVTLDGNQAPGITNEAIGGSSVNWLGLQNDGRWIVAGLFQNASPPSLPCYGIARFYPNGTGDYLNVLSSQDGFRGFVNNGNNSIFGAAFQADGKIVLGGNFDYLGSHPNGFLSSTNYARSRLGRMDNRGYVDETFAPSANETVNCVAIQPDGKILIGGRFTNVNDTARNYIARLNPDGSLDPDFNVNMTAGSFFVASMALQTDGKLIIGGTFNSINGIARNHLARLNPDGSLDMGFNPNPNNGVDGVALQSDGRVLVGGFFTSFAPNGGGSIGRNLFARLLNDPATQNLSVPDTTQAIWTRGGSSPEFSQKVVFELSTDGGTNWTTLGEGNRIGTTPNWRITGLNLPVNGLVRASGYVQCAQNNGSVSLIQSATNFTVNPLPPLITPQSLTNGVFQFTYTNANSAAFTVLATTNLSLPAASWTVLGVATNVSGTTYQFTDPAAGGSLPRFYQLRFP